MADRKRPLSPHLQVYRLPMAALMSITHRFTGVVLSFGGIMLVYWLMAATYGPDSFATAQTIMGSWIGKLVLLGVTFSLWYHLANGIRHLVWDAGIGLEIEQLKTTGFAVIGVAVVLTAITVFAVAGGA